MTNFLHKIFLAYKFLGVIWFILLLCGFVQCKRWCTIVWLLCSARDGALLCVACGTLLMAKANDTSSIAGKHATRRVSEQCHSIRIN